MFLIFTDQHTGLGDLTSIIHPATEPAVRASA
jgi:hypothetical protein